MTLSAVALDLEPPIAVLRFNRPDKLNAFNRVLLQDMLAALEQIAGDASIRAVVLAGNGRSFSAGFDIGAEGAKPSGVLEWKDYMELGQEVGRRLWRLAKPVVAAVQGHALGGGCEMAMMCDLTVAAEDATFGEPEIRFGSGSPTLIMPWIVPMKVARELIYTGKLISARRAYEIGMVNEVVPQADLERRAKYHARVLAQVSPLAIRLAKEALNRTYEMMGLESALAYNSNLTAILDGTETDEARTFAAIRTEQGLRAALAWREKQFSDLERE